MRASIVEELKETIRGVQTSMEFFSAQYDTLLAAVTANDQVINEVRAEVTELRGHMHEQAKEIQALKEELNANEQYSRLPILEIHCLPQRPQEQLGEIIADIVRNAGISDFQPSELPNFETLFKHTIITRHYWDSSFKNPKYVSRSFRNGLKCPEEERIMEKAFPEKWLFDALCYQILALQINDRALYGSVVKLPGFVSIEEAMLPVTWTSRHHGVDRNAQRDSAAGV
ncbi:hypothetical protein HPB47_006282 [Ixodes persulcatus]|uniref:Uncharacterized protein n=1 Tax=Ixodes persulcatus TaxID=34615 RepID=A0AC60PBF1_IXOPE|nr:hypothetical protein HPB47_006282 [Ixodes persulcatus]